eukprot:7386408-Prymnesium_polylepis.2
MRMTIHIDRSNVGRSGSSTNGAVMPQRRMQHGSGNRNTARARRAREAAEWDSARGAEREAQHAALM